MKPKYKGIQQFSELRKYTEVQILGTCIMGQKTALVLDLISYKNFKYNQGDTPNSIIYQAIVDVYQSSLFLDEIQVVKRVLQLSNKKEDIFPILKVCLYHITSVQQSCLLLLELDLRDKIHAKIQHYMVNNLKKLPDIQMIEEEGNLIEVCEMLSDSSVDIFELIEKLPKYFKSLHMDDLHDTCKSFKDSIPTKAIKIRQSRLLNSVFDRLESLPFMEDRNINNLLLKSIVNIALLVLTGGKLSPSQELKAETKIQELKNIIL